MATLESLREILHSTGCSCVIGNGDKVRSFHQRGIKDLYEILHNEPTLLDGAMIADKVVGKGAMALVIAGGVKSVYADVVSEAALSLANKYDTKVEYGQSAPHIINRRGDGICPVESRCAECDTVEECLKRIEEFLGN